MTKKGGRLDEIEARRFFKQIADGVEYCHSRNLVHRDLKLENILVESHDLCNLKIVDFGISSIAHSERYAYGSLKYMAPELVSGKNTDTDPKLDIWSMGCILFEMLVGRVPFAGKSRSEIVSSILHKDLEIPENEEDGLQISAQCRDILREMLVKNSTYRASLSSVLAHPWLAPERQRLLCAPSSIDSSLESTPCFSKGNKKLRRKMT